MFTKGEAESPELLINKLRGDDINWKAITSKHMPQLMCVGCSTVQFKKQFPLHQWKIVLRKKRGRRSQPINPQEWRVEKKDVDIFMPVHW